MQKAHRLLALLCLTTPLAGAAELETIVIEGRQVNLLGQAVSASEGVVGQRELQLRPLLRTGEVLELVPGLVVTQHSGTGKANQYFLRGFNLDHGTDFATWLDAMPVNMRSHGHGQGYTDLNFIIPETIAQLTYKKGAYYADIGDFSGAGSAAMQTLNRVEHGSALLTTGADSYYRLLLMDDLASASGDTLFALEATRYHGPWRDIDEQLDKTNLLIKHTVTLDDGFFSAALMAYDNSWNSADQIPQRAVQQGIVDELGSLDTDLGGNSSRYSLNAQWRQGRWQGSGYWLRYRLNLWSNFTYYLDNPLQGDQFEQVDKRDLYGGELSYTLAAAGERRATDRFGLQLRVDDIAEVGLYNTAQRQRLAAVRSDAIEQASVGAYWENRRDWSAQLRSVVGVRYDYHQFRVRDQLGRNSAGVELAANSGERSDDLFSVKGSLIYRFDNAWDGYISFGQGYHSNDARGTTISVDPSSGLPSQRVDPLVRSSGYELGARGFITDKLNTSLALWQLSLDSELLFVGDAGNTEASRGSRRRGFELTGYYHFNSQVSADLEYAYTDARFRDAQPEGNKIPGALQQVLQAGLNIERSDGWFGSVRLRYFGERPLLEDGSVHSKPTLVWNLRAGWQHRHWTLTADLLNLTDSDDHDIDYYYASRLASDSEGAAIDDIHYHVIEPRTLRLSIQRQL